MEGAGQKRWGCMGLQGVGCRRWVRGMCRSEQKWSSATGGNRRWQSWLGEGETVGKKHAVWSGHAPTAMKRGHAGLHTTGSENHACNRFCAHMCRHSNGGTKTHRGCENKRAGPAAGLSGPPLLALPAMVSDGCAAPRVATHTATGKAETQRSASWQEATHQRPWDPSLLPQHAGGQLGDPE